MIGYLRSRTKCLPSWHQYLTHRRPRLKYILLLLLLVLGSPVHAQDTVSAQQANRTAIEGTLLQVSKLPRSEGNAYPDCYYTAIIDIKQIVSGRSIPKKIILVLPGFFSRQLAPEAKYKTGDKVRATVIPFASMPDKVRQTQQADEIEDVDLDFYFPEQIASVQEFQKVAISTPFATKNQKFDGSVKFQPIDFKARAARKEQMRDDLKEINSLLAKHGGNWDKWFNSLKGFRTKYKKQYDSKAQLWVGDSFFSAGHVPDDKVYSRDFVRTIIDLKKYLSDRNVDLILVRVPTKGEVSADLFATLPSDKIQNPYLLRLYKELLEADVEIVTDIIPKAKEVRLKYPLMYWYQDFSEIHPAEGIAWVIAEEFAKRVSRYDRFESMQKKVLTLTEATRNFKWPAGNPKFNPSEPVRFSAVTGDKESPLLLKQGLDSPVLMLGSSFIGFPSLAKGSSIPHYFAYLTGVAPDLLHRSGGDRTVLRNLAREGDDFLKNRSVCLFPFVPETAYTALASLPLFDPDKSTKTLLANYSGPAMQKVIEFSPSTAKGVFSYSSDGELHILPVKSGGAAGNIRIKVPHSVSDFPYFTLEVEFTSKDLTDITVRYSGQTDRTMRSDTQIRNVEVFVFATKSSNSLDLNLLGNDGFVRPIAIKSITFSGVRQPMSYKSTK